MKRSVLSILTVVLCLSLIIFIANRAYAYQIGEGELGVNINPNVPFEAGQSGVDKIFDTIFSTAIIVSSVIFVVILLIGGILYLTSAGVEEQVKKARSMMIQAIIGLIITLSAWAIGTWIIGILQK